MSSPYFNVFILSYKKKYFQNNNGFRFMSVLNILYVCSEVKWKLMSVKPQSTPTFSPSSI